MIFKEDRLGGRVRVTVEEERVPRDKVEQKSGCGDIEVD